VPPFPGPQKKKKKKGLVVSNLHTVTDKNENTSEVPAPSQHSRNASCDHKQPFLRELSPPGSTEGPKQTVQAEPFPQDPSTLSYPAGAWTGIHGVSQQDPGGAAHCRSCGSLIGETAILTCNTPKCRVSFPFLLGKHQIT
jgi:hypothetical protein